MRDKVKREAFRPFLQDETHRVREALAAKTYALDAVKAACVAAASKGYGSVTLPPPTALDLARTDAGAAARAWLIEQGLRATWEKRTEPATGEVYPVLVIDWD